MSDLSGKCSYFGKRLRKLGTQHSCAVFVELVEFPVLRHHNASRGEQALVLFAHSAQHQRSSFVYVASQKRIARVAVDRGQHRVLNMRSLASCFENLFEKETEKSLLSIGE